MSWFLYTSLFFMPKLKFQWSASFSLKSKRIERITVMKMNLREKKVLGVFLFRGPGVEKL